MTKKSLLSLLLCLVLLFQLTGGMQVSAADYFTEPMIAGGTDYTIALKSDGSVWSWGYNEQGQLGNGTLINSMYPDQVKGLINIVSLDAGHAHSLALREDGTVLAWGVNEYGQLGDGSLTDSIVPVQVNNLTNVVAVAAGENSSLALKDDGTVWAWGENFHGTLGNGTNVDSKLPVQVTGLMNATQIAIYGAHCLALKADGTVWYWGDGLNGALQSYNTAVQMTGISDVISISAGAHHVMALKSDGTVWTWGTNWQGQLGIGAAADAYSSVPVQVINLTKVKKISAKGYHSIAMKKDGTIWSWGYNEYGQLGDGNNADSNVPVQVNNLTGTVVMCVAGAYHTIAMKGDGTIWAWGSNENYTYKNITGALGNGTVRSSVIPLQIGNGSDFFNLYAGGWFGDVPNTAWYYSYVRYMVDHDIMVGNSDTEFSPQSMMTRAMVATVLYKIEGSPTVGIAADFADIPQGAWYDDAVNWAYGSQVIAGYGNGNFGPMDNITREQFAVMMYNYAELKQIGTSNRAELSNYSDNGEISSWAVEAMQWAVSTGLISGTTETMLSPMDTTTRAECATILTKWMMYLD